MLTCRIVQHREEWNNILLGLPHAHVLQSWDWGDFKSRWGWQTQRLAWVDAGRTMAAAQVLRRAIPGTPWTFLYVTKGPLLDYGDPALAGRVLAELEAYGRQAKALFVKLDPDVPRRYGEPEAGQPLEPVGQAWLALLTRRGWRDGRKR